MSKKKEKERVEIPDGGPLPGEQVGDAADGPLEGGRAEDIAEDAPPVEVTEPVQSPTAQAIRYQDDIAGEQPTPAVPGLPAFKPVSAKESPSQRGFVSFTEARQTSPDGRILKRGTTFHGWFKRAIAKDDPESIGKGHVLEFEQWPDRAPVLVPGTEQLWAFFVDIVSEDAARRERLFEIELVQRIMSKEDPTKPRFLRFRLGEQID